MGKKLAYFLAIVVIILVASAIYFVNPFQKQAQAGLQIVVYEADASLFLDDQYLDKAPYINRTIRPGNYQLNIVPDNSELLSKNLSITLNPGTLTVVYWKPANTQEKSSGLTYELEPISNRHSGELQIISEPHEAIIYLGDRTQEFAPHIFRDLEPGDHTAQIMLPGYADTDTILQDSSEETFQEEDEQSSAENDIGASSTLTILSTNFFQNDKEVLRVRDDSSIAGNSVGFVEVGTVLTYQEIQNGWYFISFKDTIDATSKEGWVSGQFVDATSQEDSSTDESEDNELLLTE